MLGWFDLDNFLLMVFEWCWLFLVVFCWGELFLKLEYMMFCCGEYGVDCVFVLKFMDFWFVDYGLGVIFVIEIEGVLWLLNDFVLLLMYCFG